MLTCSKDFSIRVYRWVNTQSGPTTAGAMASKTATTAGAAASKTVTTSSVTAASKFTITPVAAAGKAQLESKYTLLGGSVALKTQ